MAQGGGTKPDGAKEALEQVKQMVRQLRHPKVNNYCPEMAQAGGPDGSKAEAALKAIETALGG